MTNNNTQLSNPMDDGSEANTAGGADIGPSKETNRATAAGFNGTDARVNARVDTRWAIIAIVANANLVPLLLLTRAGLLLFRLLFRLFPRRGHGF
jgi:hypothetical protein